MPRGMREGIFPRMELHLEDHVVVITGGASGIGRATAEAFAAEGARVAVWDVATCDKGGALACTVDVTDESSIGRALARTTETLGAVDHLVHAAAIGSGRFGFPFTNLSPADWVRVLEVNVMGMVNVAHAIGPGMRERGRGT